MEINFGSNEKVAAAVGIKRRHRPFKQEIRTAIVNDLSGHGIKPENIDVLFYEKGLTGVSADRITLRYGLDSSWRPVMLTT